MLGEEAWWTVANDRNRQNTGLSDRSWRVNGTRKGVYVITGWSRHGFIPYPVVLPPGASGLFDPQESPAGL
ncbi:hypothetical protein PAPYR_12991 [Paratrimastix pyriformis]|uniref:Uncharacterized protein n=1 Tax=Paratrimastix pyriformis TaxID=342808 RepID=A0ABQ8U0Z6_9EUKA|nr:hypothetical protein PAPYR_12991 [Paratrimastix pyriformis]